MTMSRKIYNVLFLCTGNSARSIMAEAAMNRWGKGRFRGFSAGSKPRGEVHPMTLRLLESLDYDVADFRSKSWDEFAKPDSPPLDFVFTVCGNAAGEVCPLWPGGPTTAHWGVDDPASFTGIDSEMLAEFKKIYLELEARIKDFTKHSVEDLNSEALRRLVREIDEIHRNPT